MDARAGIVGQPMSLFSSRPNTTAGSLRTSQSSLARSLYGSLPELSGSAGGVANFSLGTSSSTRSLVSRSWMQGRAARKAGMRKSQRFQSLGVEFEVLLNETLPLCIPAEKNQMPNAQRTAACLRMLDAFAVILGSEEVPMRQQYNLVMRELRRAIYSPEITVSEVEQYVKGERTEDAPLEQVQQSIHASHCCVVILYSIHRYPTMTSVKIYRVTKIV